MHIIVALAGAVLAAGPAVAQDGRVRPPSTPAERPKAAADGPGAPAATGRGPALADKNVTDGDYYFKAGHYPQASESYRLAVLNDPVNPWKKLAFGHALFATGNYSYASYALRRAVAALDPATPFGPDVPALFPSRRSFDKVVRDLKRYVTYSPRDPAGLSVLGYMHFATGDDDAAKYVFDCLQQLPGNGRDEFAQFFTKQLEARRALAAGTAQPVEPPRVEAIPARPPGRVEATPAPPPAVVAPKPATPAPPLALAVPGRQPIPARTATAVERKRPPPPEAARLEEDAAPSTLAPAPAIAD